MYECHICDFAQLVNSVCGGNYYLCALAFAFVYVRDAAGANFNCAFKTGHKYEYTREFGYAYNNLKTGVR